MRNGLLLGSRTLGQPEGSHTAESNINSTELMGLSASPKDSFIVFVSAPFFGPLYGLNAVGDMFLLFVPLTH